MSAGTAPTKSSGPASGTERPPRGQNLAALPQGGYQTPTPDSGAAVGPSTAPHGASTPKPETVTLPDGREVASDTLGLLERSDMDAWLRRAGVIGTAALLSIPEGKLQYTPMLGARGVLIEERLREIGITPGCLASASARAPQARGRRDQGQGWMEETQGALDWAKTMDQRRRNAVG